MRSEKMLMKLSNLHIGTWVHFIGIVKKRPFNAIKTREGNGEYEILATKLLEIERYPEPWNEKKIMAYKKS